MSQTEISELKSLCSDPRWDTIIGLPRRTLYKITAVCRCMTFYGGISNSAIELPPNYHRTATERYIDGTVGSTK